MKERTAWIIAGAVALAILLAEGAHVAITKQKVAAALREAFKRHGLPDSWGHALGIVETGLNASAVNLSGTDGARGGSFGPTQISQKTARAFGYLGAMDALRADLELAADLTARMVKEGFAERSGTVYRFGPPSTIEDMGSVWNAGRLYSDPALPSRTRNEYVPRIRSALGKVA